MGYDGRPSARPDSRISAQVGLGFGAGPIHQTMITTIPSLAVLPVTPVEPPCFTWKRGCWPLWLGQSRKDSPERANWLSLLPVRNAGRHHPFMATKTKTPSADARSAGRSGRAILTRPRGEAGVASVADTGFVRACREALRLPRKQLLAVAIARGCRHYAPLWPGLAPVGRGTLPHEILGAALLRGPADVETFQAIRCGAMVLSDLGNSPERIAEAAIKLGVSGRVAHVARLGQVEDDHAEFWGRVLSALPFTATGEDGFLPGLSRFISETRLAGLGHGPARVWLRTHYRP